MGRGRGRAVVASTWTRPAAAAVIAWSSAAALTVGAPTAARATSLAASLDGTPVPVDPTTLTIDEPLRGLTLRYANGTEEVRSVGGTSPRQLLVDLGIPAESVRSMAINWRDRRGAPATLSPAEILHGFDGDPDHCAPCSAAFSLVTSNVVTVRFFRPLRNEDDANGDDFVTPAQGQPLVISIDTGRTERLAVDGRVDDVTPDPGQRVTFTANTQGLPVGTMLRWDLGDGSPPVRGALVSHAYAAGRYLVSVTAIAPDGRAGIDTLPALQVGPVGDAVATSPAGQPTGPAAGGSGGSGSGGGTGADGGGRATGGVSSGAAAGGGAGGAGTAPRRGSGRASEQARDPSRVDSSAPDRDAGESRGRTASGPREAQGSATASSGQERPGPSFAPPPDAAGSTPMAASPRPERGAATSPQPSDRSGRQAGERVPVVRGALVPIRGLAVVGFGSGPIAGRTASFLVTGGAELKRGDADASRRASRAGAGHSGSVLGWVTGGVVIVGLLSFGAATELRRTRAATIAVP